MAEPAPLQTIYPASWTESVFPAGDWALEERLNARKIMGRGDEILWADEEPFYIVGDTGHGKSTFGQNIIRCSIGLIPNVIGMDVKKFDRILYIAADRPAQTRASIARMVDYMSLECWNSHVLVHEGPIGFWMDQKPEMLLEFAAMPRDHWGGKTAQVLVIDSLKDLATSLNGDEEGTKYNMGVQMLCREGIQVLGTHHPRKQSAMQKKQKEEWEPTLDDIYGSKFLPAGAGSVLFLHRKSTGSTGLYHLKSPMGEMTFSDIRFEGRTGMAQVVG
jgi:replicative DNA helicase